MLKRAAALFLVFTGIASWIGCGTTTSRYVYAAIPASNELVAYREDPNAGVLTALSGSPITAGSAVHSVAIHPSKKFLYAANSGFPGDISLFTISTSGALTEVTPRTVAGTSPTLMVMDSAGSFLYVANTGSNDISVFSIDSGSGALTPVGAPFGIGISALNLKLSPSGNFLYVAAAGSPGFIEVLSVTAGALQVVQVAQAGTNPYGLAIDPSGSFLYTGNAAPDNSFSEFAINADGSLTELPGSPQGESYSGPIALLVDNSGKYLYAANEGSNNLAAYSIGSDGGLTLLTNSPFSVGAQPSFMTSDPGGKFLFVGNQSSPVIQAFSLDTGSGTLTSVASYSVPGTATSIAVSP